jgi:hypothetical protein
MHDPDTNPLTRDSHNKLYLYINLRVITKNSTRAIKTRAIKRRATKLSLSTILVYEKCFFIADSSPVALGRAERPSQDATQTFFPSH